jgi:hypothetical protein
MRAQNSLANFCSALAGWLIVLFLLHAGSAVVGAEPDKKTSTGFTYLETIDSPGSKSAGIRGTLLFNGNPLRAFPGQVKTPIGSFFFVNSALSWEPQGWFPVLDIVVQTTSAAVSADTLLAGSYKGARRAGTPVDWCYVPELDTWFDPRQLTEGVRRP